MDHQAVRANPYASLFGMSNTLENLRKASGSVAQEAIRKMRCGLMRIHINRLLSELTVEHGINWTGLVFTLNTIPIRGGFFMRSTDGSIPVLLERALTIIGFTSRKRVGCGHPN